MKLSELNEWLTLTANFGVLLGIVFLGIEIQQNTRAIERQVNIDSANALHGEMAGSQYYPDIQLKINAVQGGSEIVDNYVELFDLTPEQAERWWRRLAQMWGHNEADWIYRGRDDTECSLALTLLRFQDQQLFYEFWKQRLEPGYVRCIDANR